MIVKRLWLKNNKKLYSEFNCLGKFNVKRQSTATDDRLISSYYWAVICQSKPTDLRPRTPRRRSIRSFIAQISPVKHLTARCQNQRCVDPATPSRQRMILFVNQDQFRLPGVQHLEGGGFENGRLNTAVRLIVPQIMVQFG